MRHTVFAIGVNEYDNAVDLRFCGNDATLFASTLEATTKAEVEVWASAAGKESPSSHDLSDIVERIGRIDATDDDCIIFYFAGHGFESGGRDFLMGKDSVPGDVDTAVATDAIISALRKTKAGMVAFIMDACRTSRQVRGNLGVENIKFGEGTRGASRTRGIISIFGCSVGEVCQEFEDDEGVGHGVFTYILCDYIAQAGTLVPYNASPQLKSRVQGIILKRNLMTQTPEIATSDVSGASVDLVSGAEIHLTPQPKRLLLLCGPPHAGKSTIGALLASRSNFIQVEMSTYVYRRWLAAREDDGYNRPIQQYMDDVVWAKGDYDLIAQDLLRDHRGSAGLIVCGPRRPEEIETLKAAGFEVHRTYLYADSRTRYDRYWKIKLAENVIRAESGLTLTQFVKRDLQEHVWGLPKIGVMKNCAIVDNTGTLEATTDTIVGALSDRNWFPQLDAR